MKTSSEDSSELKNNFLPEEDKVKEEKSAKAASVTSSIQRERRGIAYAVLAQFIWALGTIVTRFGTECDKFSPNSYSTWRSFFMTLVTCYSIKKKNITLQNPMTIKSKGWFATRTLGTYLSFLCYISSLLYLRISTAACLGAAHPFVVIILSILVLHEAFYIRYLIGIIVCFIGSAMIILNEKHGNPNTASQEEKRGNIVLGLIYVSLDILFWGGVVFSQKLMMVEKVSTDTQIFYTGFSNTIMGILICIYEGNFGLNLWLIFFTFLNAVIFYYGQAITDWSLQYMDVSKFAPITYIQTLFVFVLSLIIFGEKFYFTDIIGNFLIVSFQLYNAYNPIINKDTP